MQNNPLKKIMQINIFLTKKCKTVVYLSFLLLSIKTSSISKQQRNCWADTVIGVRTPISPLMCVYLQ